MPIFKEMKPEDVLKQLEGHKNVIKDEMDKVNEFFSKLECVSCRGSCHPVVNPEKLFEANAILPNFIAECNECGAQFSPYTRIVVRRPTKDPLAG